jgi:hypothetical protein
MSPQTHNTLSLFPFPRSVISEVAGPYRFPHRTSRDTHRGLAPERRPSDRKFYLYESPSSSSQDSKSNSSKSTGSEGPEERRRDRMVSPYGSFFAEEMEFDTPAESRGPFRQGDGQEQPGGAFLPATWTSSQAPVPSLSGMMPAPDHDATGIMITPLSLAENSRQSQPPLSWRRQGYLDQDRHSQCDPQVARAIPCDTGRDSVE